jgi:NAD(P)-dependent dehydrogenase (short-subunit alcohol dehydrogenase family)
MKLGTGEHVAVGTGGASGKGRSVADVFGKYGMHVALTNALSKPGC